MLERLDRTIISQSCSWLDSVLKKYDREESLSCIFPKHVNRIDNTPIQQREKSKILSVTVKPAQQFNCDSCNISCTSQLDLDAHLASKKHKNKQPEAIVNHGGNKVDKKNSATLDSSKQL